MYDLKNEYMGAKVLRKINSNHILTVISLRKARLTTPKKKTKAIPNETIQSEKLVFS